MVCRAGDAPARWGLVPTWWKEPDTLPTFHNARAETAASKPSFRGAVRYRRVIVPATGFYEWDRARDRQPVSITPRDRPILGLAGLGTVYTRGPHALETAAILTVDAGAAMQGVHDRMPAILAPERWDAWMSTDTPVDDALAMCRPLDEGLDVIDVGRGVNNARHTDGSWFRAAVGSPPVEA